MSEDFDADISDRDLVYRPTSFDSGDTEICTVCDLSSATTATLELCTGRAARLGRAVKL